MVASSRHDFAFAERARSWMTRDRIWTCFLIYVFVFSVWFSYRYTVELQPFSYGDWVIHYAHGFVRRGLIGQAIIGAFGVANAPLGVLVTKVALYAVFLLCVRAIFRPLLKDTLLFVCLLMPMGFAYSVVESLGGGRKELILLCALALQVAWLVRTRAPGTVRSANLHALLLTAALSVVVLSHEAMLLYCGFPLLVLYLDCARIGGVRWALVRVAMSFAVLAGLFLLQSLMPGTPQQAELMCRTLAASAPAECLQFSAISWLGYSARRAMTDVVRLMSEGALHSYMVSALLCAVPLWLLVRGQRSDPSARVGLPQLKLGILVALFLTLPTYLVSMDWGRWQYITVCSLLLVMGYASRTRLIDSSLVLDRLLRDLGSSESIRPIARACFGAIGFAYLFMWNAPLCNPGLRHGHIGVIERLMVRVDQALSR